jgi:hypothetical protein
VLTNDSILLEAMQQACRELLEVQIEAGTVFNLSYQFDEHVGRHRQTIISLENISSPVALLQSWRDTWLCIWWRVLLCRA